MTSTVQSNRRTSPQTSRRHNGDRAVHNAVQAFYRQHNGPDARRQRAQARERCGYVSDSGDTTTVTHKGETTIVVADCGVMRCEHGANAGHEFTVRQPGWVKRLAALYKKAKSA